MTSIGFVDVTIRDGNQSLWGGMGMSTDAVLPIAPILDQVGYRAVDFINSMMMWAAVKFHKEDPWDRIRRTSELMPNTRLGLITATQRFITWVTPPDIHDLALQLVVRNGIRRIWITDPSNEMDKALRLARVVKQAGDVEVVVGICYTVSPFHTDEYFAERAGQLAGSPDVDAVYMKDAGGLLTPERVHDLAPALRAALGSTPLTEIHTHANTGLAPLSHLAAIDEGIGVLHTAAAPLANGTSHPSVETTVGNLRSRGLDVELDMKAAALVSEHFRQIARRDGFPVGHPLEHDTSYYVHQLPGGMVSTMRRQLGEIGMVHRLHEVLDEVCRVRAELGYPIMITPLSQFVGTQALSNVVTGQRYSVIPDEVIYYCLGHFGPPAGPMSDEVLDRVAAHPRTPAIQRQLSDAGGEVLRDARRRLGAGVSEEDLVLRVLMSDREVDQVVRRRVPEWRENSATAPLHFLLKALDRRKDVRHFRLKADGVEVEVRR